MQYFTELLPLFEARIYLIERFSKNRASSRIIHFESQKELISINKWTYFKQIIDLQNELDKLIPVDSLMERYFAPIKTKSEMPCDHSLTLGGMLLCPPPSYEFPLDYDSLIECCKNAPQQDLLKGYFTSTLSPFFADNCDVSTISIPKIVSFVNNTVVNIKDKWAVIDCISNPCGHLERLRPLVENVMNLITEKSRTFCGFIAAEMESLYNRKSLVRNLSEIIRSEIKIGPLTDAKIYPSLFAFNSIELSFKPEPFEISRLIIGVYINTYIDLKEKGNNVVLYTQLLKMLSDQTRFNILHELCGRQSYGQELADKFGGARSAIYYHLEKLLGYGLVDLEMTEYRMLYTMNKQNVYDRMNAIRDYLLDGWKPEAKQEEAQTETPETGGERGAEK